MPKGQSKKLALLGGKKTVRSEPPEVFKWPIVNREMEEAVLQVLRDGNMSGTDITMKFERGFADWHGRKYALGHSSGTASLHSAMYGVGLGPGDEIIVPSITFWASAAQALSLGVAVSFADILPETLCIDPADLERRISPYTKALMVVHYLGMPTDMDPIMKIARARGLKVIEDVSHAHGSLYKGKLAGTFGDVAGFSLMSGKAFAIGEAGILITDDLEIYERAIVFGHYERHGQLTLPALKAAAGLPWGGYKYRMHQMSSAVGLAQLKKYPAEMAEIDQAMNYFWDLLEGTPGIRPHRPPKGSGSTMGGWYAPHGLYRPEELGSLSVTTFCEAVEAEGVGGCVPGCNKALHLHPLFKDLDVYGHGRPTNGAFLPDGGEHIRKAPPMPVAEGIQERVFTIPWFKKFDKPVIEAYAEAFRKVAENHEQLLPRDKKTSGPAGKWALSIRI